MPTTSNFGWTTPADTDLVKDGAAAIRTLGNGIDTSFLDLKGGTSGQVLSKNSNTDLDYTWITPNVGDITEVQAGTGISVASGTGPIPVVTNTVATAFDAAGDLVYGTGADTFTKLSLGTAGKVLKVNSGATAPEWGVASGGLTLISSTAIGTTVSSVTVTGAFSATYDSYKVIVTGDTASTANALNLTLGATSTGYYRFYLLGAYNSATVTGENVSNGSNWSDITRHSATSVLGEFDLHSPFLSKNTMIYKFNAQPSTTGSIFLGGGYLNDTTSYTAFTLTTAAGTVSGGTIRVYGYQNS